MWWCSWFIIYSRTRGRCDSLIETPKYSSAHSNLFFVIEFLLIQWEDSPLISCMTLDNDWSWLRESRQWRCSVYLFKKEIYIPFVLAFERMWSITISLVLPDSKCVLFLVPHTQWSQFFTYGILLKLWAKARFVIRSGYHGLKAVVNGPYLRYSLRVVVSDTFYLPRLESCG